MKCNIPGIAYHNRDPVLSCDFQPVSSDGVVRLATGGSDTHVVIWSVSETGDEEKNVDLELLSDLTRHQKAVNIVRWSPDGGMLASGDDESIIIIWQRKEGPAEGGGLFDDDENQNRENWTVYKIIRFHLDDVYDLSWSPCGELLLSGSVDNSAIVSNIHKNKKLAHFSDSRGFIQGVSWNKKHPLMSTIGGDRTCRTYSAGPNKKLIYKTYKATLNLKNNPSGEKKKQTGDKLTSDKKTDEPSNKEDKPIDEMNVDDPQANKVTTDNKDDKDKPSEDAKKPLEKSVRLFHDDTFKGFFRRLSWSNDGELLVVPSGVMETDGDTKVNHCTWVFSRVDMSKPAICLPTKDKYTIAARFSPIMYKLRMGKKKQTVDSSQPWVAANSLFSLPYRLVYAVATQNAVMFYDTQQAAPFARVCNIHYAGLTDVTWSPCGNIVIVSSSDGYCSIISFTPGELGDVYEDISKPINTEVPEEVKTVSTEPAPVPSTLSVSQSGLPVPTFTSQEGLDEQGVRSPAQVQIRSAKEGGKPNPKRLQFITLSSPKADKKLSGHKRSAGQDDMDSVIERYEAMGHEEEKEDDLSLVLEESQSEAPPIKAAVGEKKRVPLTTLLGNKPPAATPEKTGKGRRVSLITLSSPKPKS